MQAKADTRRFIAITENSKVLFFSYQLGFNKFIQKAKEFFPNIHTNFLTLADLDSPSLNEEVMGGDMYSFMVMVITTLDKRFGTTTFDPSSEGDPPLSSKMDQGPNPSFAKPPRAPRSKKKKK